MSMKIISREKLVSCFPRRAMIIKICMVLPEGFPPYRIKHSYRNIPSQGS